MDAAKTSRPRRRPQHRRAFRSARRRCAAARPAARTPGSRAARGRPAGRSRRRAAPGVSAVTRSSVPAGRRRRAPTEASRWNRDAAQDRRQARARDPAALVRAEARSAARWPARRSRPSPPPSTSRPSRPPRSPARATSGSPRSPTTRTSTSCRLAGPQRRRRRRDVGADLALDHHAVPVAQQVLHRFLDGQHAAGAPLDQVLDQRGERGGLAAPRAPPPRRPGPATAARSARASRRAAPACRTPGTSGGMSRSERLSPPRW